MSPSYGDGAAACSSVRRGPGRAAHGRTVRAGLDACLEARRRLRRRLGDGRGFLLGGRFTEADVRLFVTLVRFDVAYHGLFKCNLRRIADYPALSRYQARILAIPGVRDTVSIDHIKRGYYSIKALNPTGIVPVGPECSLG